MILDLEKLREVEAVYINSKTSLEAIQNMVRTVTADSNKTSLAYQTLKQLGIIRDKKEIEQLNS